MFRDSFLQKVDCKWASIGLCGVCDTHGGTSISDGLIGVGVRNFIRRLKQPCGPARKKKEVCDDGDEVSKTTGGFCYQDGCD
jgi:hypothetical protein